MSGPPAPQTMTVLRSGLTAALFLLAPLRPATAQQFLVGTVADPARAPIAGADVLIGNQKATTDAKGAFRIASIKPGVHAVTVRAVGYRAERTRIVVTPSEVPELAFILVPAPAPESR